MERRPGSGPLRIGECMEINSDLYSMLFVSALRPEYVYYYDKETKKRNMAAEKLLREYRREDLDKKKIGTQGTTWG